MMPLSKILLSASIILGYFFPIQAASPHFDAEKDSSQTDYVLALTLKGEGFSIRAILPGEKIAYWLYEVGPKQVGTLIRVWPDSLQIDSGIYALSTIKAISQGRAKPGVHALNALFGVLCFPAGFIIGIVDALSYSRSMFGFYAWITLFSATGITLFHLPRKFRAKRIRFSAMPFEEAKLNNLISKKKLLSL